MHWIRFKIIFNKELYILHEFDKSKNENLLSVCNKVLTKSKEYNKNKLDIEILSKNDIIFFSKKPNINIEFLKKYYNIIDIGIYKK
jgi:hypothetical protein